MVAAASVMLAVYAGVARADDAEVVSLTGKGDSRVAADAEWKPTAVKSKLQAGWFVRTREASQMALVMKDGTQVRLNQLSILNIKAVAVAGQPTRLELPQGRAWAQAKTRTDVASGAKKPGVEVATPAGTARIRGTDWELNVDADGTSTVTVLSGEVEFFNEQGSVSVGANEQARAQPGKAPVKILLTQAAERVQWVTAYRPQPRRWVKDGAGLEPIIKSIEAEDYAPALAALEAAAKGARPEVRVALLLADLRLFQGEAAQAIALLSPHAAEGKGEAMASALLVRALLVAGRIAEAERVLANAAAVHPTHAEVLLSRAELARVQGDAVGARTAATKVLEADAKNAEAWYVIGRIETEREYATAAREALNQALALRPDGPGYQGELGSLETFANEFAQAQAAFDAALERQPDDYVALTGLGILQLKRGETEAALESFLKAGVIEPRYARAALFTAVAYYQLGERARALEALAKASSLDDKDPVPYLMSSLVYYDSLDLGRSIEEARKAQQRLPYLKSLNQIANDQKGSANLGSALAAFGMEEWSQAYAYDSYSPYWAGSHLFLADRFSGSYNKNSELFKGFLSDPSVFGASNRFSSLVPVPGHYASLSATGSRDYYNEAGLNATLNGYSVGPKPLSYFLSFDKTDGDSEINRTKLDGRMRARGDNLIVGLGAKPTHELGLFAFANAADYDGHFAERVSGLVDDNFNLDYRRIDTGFNYKFNPTNHAWLKIGGGSEKGVTAGALLSSQAADAFNASVLGQIFRFSPAGRLNAFQYDQSQRDVQWRHTFDAAPRLQLSWGLEYAKEKKPLIFDFQLPASSSVVQTVSAVRSQLVQDNQIEAGTAYLSGRGALAPTLEAQLDLAYQNVKTSFTTNRATELVGLGSTQTPSETGEIQDREFNPRLGFKWRFAPAQTLRLAGQVWRKPPGVNTLAQVDTLGIALDDQSVAAGGRLKRVRLQHEMELGARTFVNWFADAKDIENPQAGGADIVSDLQLVDLEKLRTRKSVYALAQDYLEDTPKFGAGKIRSLGLALNHLVTRDLTLAARYIYADTENTTAELSGRAVPYHPRHYTNLTLTWRPYARWIVGPSATYRSTRYGDDENTELLTSGWAFGLQVYWESEDKRLSIGALVNHLHSDKQSSIYRHPVAQVQAAFRF